MGWEGPKWGREVLFPANPDLAVIFGRTVLYFEFSVFVVFDFRFLDFQVPRFPKSGLGLGLALGLWALGLLFQHQCSWVNSSRKRVLLDYAILACLVAVSKYKY